MAKAVQPIPDDKRMATPYLSVGGAAQALDFYARAFAAVEITRMPMPDGRIGHAEIRIGDATVMLADEFPEMNFRGPLARGGTTVTIHIYVEDVDALVARAVAAGATLEAPLVDEFYGDRVARLVDPYGHRWMFATHIEDVSAQEMQRRAESHFSERDLGGEQ